MKLNTRKVWVFQGANAKFPSGIFTQQSVAEEWIAANRFSGILTEYPVDISVFDLHATEGTFIPIDDSQCSREFRQSFTSATQPHFHYTDGIRE